MMPDSKQKLFQIVRLVKDSLGELPIVDSELRGVDGGEGAHGEEKKDAEKKVDTVFLS